MMVFRWNFPGGRPASNFDTFVVALLTVFQVQPLFFFPLFLNTVFINYFSLNFVASTVLLM